MTYKKHDKNSSGFYVKPEQLAHDLALLKTSKSAKLNPNSNEHDYYNVYLEELVKFRNLIDSKTRYDSASEEVASDLPL